MMKKALRIFRRIIWALLVGYMIAWHNFYHQDNQMPNSIELAIEEDDLEEDAAPK